LVMKASQERQLIAPVLDAGRGHVRILIPLQESRTRR
jgi:hypothetical protein